MSKAVETDGGASILPLEVRRGTKAYDLMAAIPLLVWYALVAKLQLGAIADQVHALAREGFDIGSVTPLLAELAVFLFMATLIVLLFIRRPAKASAQGILPRVAAILGTYLNVAIVALSPASTSPIVLGISAALILCGTAFAVHCVLYLGRSFSVMAEARRLVTGGPYAVIRHPLYVAEEVAIVGAALQFFSPLTAALLALQIACQIYRMHCEENVLEKCFPEYAAYKAQTFRVVPHLY